MARGARRGNPNIEVSGSGDFSINLESFQRYVQRGMFGTNGLNGVNIHAYIGATPPEGEFIDRVIGMCEILKDAGFGDLPVYITEFGWSRGSNTREYPIPNPADHPRYVARSLALLAAQPIDAIIWHCMRHSGPTVRAEDELGYQLLNTDHTPSASYVAYVNAVKWLSGIKRGDARWFRISPRLNLVLGRTRDRIVGVAWSTEGEAPFELPGEPLCAVDMMGRAIAPAQQVTLSPSPIFFELSQDNTFIDLPAKPALTGYPGQTVDTGLDRLATPAGIAAAGSVATVSKAAIPGTYLLAGHEAESQRRVLQPLTIPPPLVLQSLDQVLSADCRALEVVATVMPSIAGAARATLTLETGESLSAEAPIAPGDVRRISVPVPSFEVGKRIEGELRIDTIGDIPFSVGGKVDTSALPTVRLEDRPDWDLIPATDFSAWAPSKQLAREDCSATVQTAAATDGLHIRVTVNDEIHRQTRPLGAIWEEDSIQFAFDVDADKPWQFNLIMDGRCNGHRVFYYDICRPSDERAVIVWRNRADCPGFGAKCLAPEVRTDIRRETARTVYDIVFPWKSLDLEQAPPVGTQLGFALVVNDADKGYDREVLRFGHGIAGPQNPELYATLKVVEAGAGEPPNPSVKHIQRTMRSLAGERNPGEKVRILFYGQSITAQGWWRKVVDQLKAQFPEADIEAANPAIGGFTSPALRRTAYHDLYPFYPDLLIFHVYGDLENYEAIIKKTRETTTAEILLWTDHVAKHTGRIAGDDRHSDGIREIAGTYDCMLIDVRKEWKQYLATTGQAPEALLRDDIHLNADGVALLAQIIGREIERTDAFGGNTAAEKQIIDIPVDSGPVARKPDGSLSIDFTGNRIVAVSNGKNPTGNFKVLLDGKELNTFPGVWGVTLPSKGINWMPCIRRVEIGENPVAESWTLTCLDDSTPDGKKIHFKLTGSVTGDDGEGWNNEDFVSKSGRIKIAKRDWAVAGTLRIARKTLKKDFQITWETYPMFKSRFSPGTAGTETVLIQGIENAKHTLTLIPEAGGADLGLTKLRSYCPAEPE